MQRIHEIGLKIINFWRNGDAEVLREGQTQFDNIRWHKGGTQYAKILLRAIY